MLGTTSTYVDIKRGSWRQTSVSDIWMACRGGLATLFACTGIEIVAKTPIQSRLVPVTWPLFPADILWPTDGTTVAVAIAETVKMRLECTQFPMLVRTAYPCTTAVAIHMFRLIRPTFLIRQVALTGDHGPILWWLSTVLAWTATNVNVTQSVCEIPFVVTPTLAIPTTLVVGETTSIGR